MNKLQFTFVFENTSNSPTFAQDINQFIALLQKVMERKVTFTKISQRIEEMLKESE